MVKLSADSFERARRFLKTEARPLERTLFEFHFEGGSVEVVMGELAAFQNDDGGFGRALEPDLRTPSSSALATGIGLRILKELGSTVEALMARQAVTYLGETLDPSAWVWQVAPGDSNHHPHAPWWHDEEGSLARTFDDFLVIPRAELLALLIHYSSLVPAAWLLELTERTLDDLQTIEPLGTGGGDDLVYALRLAETAELLDSWRNPLLSRLRAVVPKVVSRDPAEWSGYCIKPLKVAPSPTSPVADLLGDLLYVHLDYLIENQRSSGAWDPVWSWGEAYPEAWAKARREWQGCLTLDNLIILRSYGRLQ